MPSVNPLTVIVAGPQGSGKDTQVALLKEYLEKNDPSRPTVHFDAGTALRAFSEGPGYTQVQVKESLSRGELQPMFILASVMASFLLSSMKGNEHLLVSGFPRSEDQQMLFDSAMNFYKRELPTLLFITLPEQESLARLLKRGRNDDTEEGIRERLRWNHAQTLPVLQKFKEDKAYTYTEVDGNRTREEVHADILAKLGLA
jgi:adenylate kinase